MIAGTEGHFLLLVVLKIQDGGHLGCGCRVSAEVKFWLKGTERTVKTICSPGLLRDTKILLWKYAHQLQTIQQL